MFSQSTSKSQSVCAISSFFSISACLSARKRASGPTSVFFTPRHYHSCSEMKLQMYLKCRPCSLMSCFLTHSIIHFQSNFFWIKDHPWNIGWLQDLSWWTLPWRAFCMCRNWLLFLKLYFNCMFPFGNYWLELLLICFNAPTRISVQNVLALCFMLSTPHCL